MKASDICQQHNMSLPSFNSLEELKRFVSGIKNMYSAETDSLEYQPMAVYIGLKITVSYYKTGVQLGLEWFEGFTNGLSGVIQPLASLTHTTLL